MGITQREWFIQFELARDQNETHLKLTTFDLDSVRLDTSNKNTSLRFVFILFVTIFMQIFANFW